MVVPRRCLERACPDSADTIRLRDDRPSAKPLASAPPHSAVASERLGGTGLRARYPIYEKTTRGPSPRVLQIINTRMAGTVRQLLLAMCRCEFSTTTGVPTFTRR